jgi:hypothetical protein
MALKLGANPRISWVWILIPAYEGSNPPRPSLLRDRGMFGTARAVRAGDDIVTSCKFAVALEYSVGESRLRALDMKALIRVVAFSALFVLPAASFAQDSKTTVIVPSVVPLQANPTQQTVEAEKMVCHAPRPMMGTRFSGPRICKTQRQWDAERHEAKEDIEKLQDRGCLYSGVCPK